MSENSKKNLAARFRAALESEAPKTVDVSAVREAQKKLARMGIGSFGKYSPAADGKNVLVEGVLSRTVFVPESFDQPHQTARDLRGENGQTCVEVFSTRVQDGVEFLRVRKDSFGLSRAESYLTDSRGIILPTAEAQQIRNNVAQQVVEENGHADVREAIRVEGFFCDGVWVSPDDLEQDEKDSEKVSDGHRFLSGGKTQAQIAFDRMREASKHDPREHKDAAELCRKEAEADAEKLRAKWAEIAEISKGAVSRIANLPEVEPVIPAEKQVEVRLMTFSEMLKSQKKRVANRPENPDVDKIAAIESKRKGLSQKVRKLNKQIRQLQKDSLTGKMVWDKNIGDWVSPLQPQIEKLTRERDSLSQEVSWCNEDLRAIRKW